MTAERPAYAATTKVPVAKTRMEIDLLLEKIGATTRATAVDDLKNRAQVVFVLKGAHYRIDVPLPKCSSPGNLAKHEQAVRSRWRGVLLLLKAKIEAVRLGLSSYDREFLPDLVLGNGRTVFENIPALMQSGLPQLTQGNPR